MRPEPNVRHAVVVGTANGALLRELLMHQGFARATLLTTRRFLRTPCGIDDAVVDPAAWREGLPAADHALLVYGAVRREREALLWRPERRDLVPLATALHGRGVRTLQLVLSHGTATLSASERRALAQLGFDPRRGAQTIPAVTGSNGSWPARLATWMIHVLLVSMRQVSASRARHNESRFR